MWFCLLLPWEQKYYICFVRLFVYQETVESFLESEANGFLAPPSFQFKMSQNLPEHNWRYTHSHWSRFIIYVIRELCMDWISISDSDKVNIQNNFARTIWKQSFRGRLYCLHFEIRDSPTCPYRWLSMQSFRGCYSFCRDNNFRKIKCRTDMAIRKTKIYHASWVENNLIGFGLAIAFPWKTFSSGSATSSDDGTWLPISLFN